MRTCPTCGCDLDADAAVCPLCGAVVEPLPSESGGASGAEAGSALPYEHDDALFVPLPSFTTEERDAPRAVRVPLSRRKLIIGAGAAAVVAAGGLIGWGIFRDARLRQRAAEAVSAEPSLVAVTQDSAAEQGKPVPLPGSSAAGGSLAQVGETLYQVRADGIYRVEGLDAGAIKHAERWCSARPSWLVAAGDSLWYLNADAGSEPAAYRDRAVRLCRCDLADDNPVAETVYAAPEGGTLSSCVEVDGTICFLQREAGGFFVLSLTADDPTPTARHHFEAERAWLIAEGETCYAVQTGQGSWAVTRAQGVGGAFEQIAEGQGALEALAFSGGVLYAGVAADDAAPARFMVNDLRGNVSEHADLAGAALIAAAGDVVAVMRGDGSVSWLNASTGFTHEAAWFSEKTSGAFSPVSSTWAVCSGTIYATGPDGSACAFAVETGEGVLVDSGS